MKYKVGDKVVLRSDIKGSVSFIKDFKKLTNRTVIIKEFWCGDSRFFPEEIYYHISIEDIEGFASDILDRIENRFEILDL